MLTDSWNNATPEQKNLWRHASGLLAFTTITPLYFMGNVAGSEFNAVYSVNKLYIALELGFDALAYGAGESYVDLFDEHNISIYHVENCFFAWNGAAVRYISNTIQLKNHYFSRVDAVGMNSLRFNGYRLDVI